MEDAVETTAVKREDQRTREWPRARGQENLFPLDKEREKEDRGEESANESEKAEKSGEK